MKKTRKKLLRIAELVEGWAKRGGVDELERDMVLGMLQEVYFEIKYAKAKPGKKGAAGAPVMAPEPLPIPMPVPVPEEVAADDALPEGDDCRMPEAEDGTEEAPSALWWNRKPVVEEVAAEDVAREETPPAPRRVDHDMIRSLYGAEGPDEKDGDGQEYGEDNEDEKVPEAVEKPSEAIEKPAKAAEKPEKVAAKAVEKAPAAPPAAPVTLGDTVGARRQTLGEVLRSGEKDTAAKIAAADHPSLKKSIGLNDRFLMIRDLFDGDGAEFDIAIEKLDSFTDLDEAIIHIHDNYDWSADSEGAALVVELLERKLG